jgi:hypothetical protein
VRQRALGGQVGGVAGVVVRLQQDQGTRSQRRSPTAVQLEAAALTMVEALM